MVFIHVRNNCHRNLLLSPASKIWEHPIPACFFYTAASSVNGNDTRCRICHHTVPLSHIEKSKILLTQQRHRRHTQKASINHSHPDMKRELHLLFHKKIEHHISCRNPPQRHFPDGDHSVFQLRDPEYQPEYSSDHFMQNERRQPDGNQSREKPCRCQRNCSGICQKRKNRRLILYIDRKGQHPCLKFQGKPDFLPYFLSDTALFSPL